MRKFIARIRCLLGRHAWEDCVCQVCGKTRHEWKYVVEPDVVTEPVANFMDEMHYYRQRCTRCGEWKK